MMLLLSKNISPGYLIKTKATDWNNMQRHATVIGDLKCGK